MTSQLEKKLRTFKSAYVTYADLCTLLPTSEDARFSQIKRALKEGYLVRLRKGLYRQGQYLNKDKPHSFEMSQYIHWPSYVSLESALSYHELIPEAVYGTTSVTTTRSLQYQNEFGVFSYRTLPKKNFFMGVTRVVEHQNIFMIATPWKAITDYLYCYKKDWTTLAPFNESLRIELSELPQLSSDFANALGAYYNSKRIHTFLKNVTKS